MSFSVVFRLALYMADRSLMVFMKSLKCPACSAASCLLSEKLRIFCFSGFRPAFRSSLMEENDRMVVEVLLPSFPSFVSLFRSCFWWWNIVPLVGSSSSLVGINQPLKGNFLFFLSE